MTKIADPLKQGLKLGGNKPGQPDLFDKVREADPLKQGLKPLTLTPGNGYNTIREAYLVPDQTQFKQKGFFNQFGIHENCFKLIL